MSDGRFPGSTGRDWTVHLHFNIDNGRVDLSQDFMGTQVVKLDSLAEHQKRALNFPFRLEDFTTQEKAIGIIWVELKGPVQGDFGLLVAAQLVQEQGLAAKNLRV